MIQQRWANYLRDCLQSLVEQKADNSLFEVIVVNNNSTDNTLEVANEFTDKFTYYKIITEEKQGLSHARNRGAKESSGEWVGYVDDDGIVRPDCVDVAFFTISHYNFDCFGGVVVDLKNKKTPKWLHYNLYPRIGETSQEGVSELKDACFLGTLCFWKKKILEQFPFDPELGMKGSSIGYSEESTLQKKLRRLGKIIGFNPILVLDHAIPEHKQKVSWFLQSSFVLGKNYWLGKPTPRYYDLLKIVWLLFVLLARNTLAIPFRILTRRKYYIQNVIIDTLTPAANRAGRIVSAWRLLRLKENKE